VTKESLPALISDLVPLNFPGSSDSSGRNAEITGCYTGDLLSDVLAHAKPGQILLTVQAHGNTIAVAKEKQLPAIIFCNGRKPAPDALQLADQWHIALFSTEYTSFETASAIARFLPNHE